MKEKLYTDENLSTAIGMMSLVGIHGDAPYSWGNYFSLVAGPRVVNFWAENLEAANRRFNLGKSVQVRRYKTEKGDWCLIADNRIPDDWYYNKLCFTGGWVPPLEILQDMYSYRGDSTNEIERYSNPEKYWAERGGSYNPKTGIISMRIDAPSARVGGA